MMFLDSVYASSKGGPRFYEQPEFETETVMKILEMIYKRLFGKLGYVALKILKAKIREKVLAPAVRREPYEAKKHGCQWRPE